MKNRQIAIGALLSYGAIVFNIVAGLLYTPWMIRAVGDDHYALYTLALSVINIFLMDFGVGAAVSRFLAKYYAEKRYEEANRFMGIVYKVFLAISAAIAVCLFVFYWLIDGVYQNLSVSELQIFKRLFLIVAAYSVLSFPFTTFNGVLMANERFVAVKACSFGQKVLSVALIIAALLMGGDVYALVMVHAISNVVFVLIKFFCVRRGTALRANLLYWDKKTAKELFDFSAWVTVMSLAQRCIFNIMPSVIAAIVGSTEVTLFSLAATLEGYVYGFADAINGMFLPMISRIMTNDNAGKKLSALMSAVGRFHVATIGLLYVGFLAVGQHFVALWMGDGYSEIYVCAALLILPSLIDVPQQVAKTALLAQNVVREQAVIYMGMAAVNLVLAFGLIPLFASVGAAASVCIAYIFRTAAFNVLYKKKLSLPLAPYFQAAYGRWLPVALVTLAVSFGVNEHILPGGGWGALAVKIMLITVSYGLMFICIGVKKEERRALIDLVRGGRR